MIGLLAQTNDSLSVESACFHPVMEDPAGILAVLLGVLAVIFWLAQRPVIGRVFNVIPSLVFCYFVPTALTTFGFLPAESALYTWVIDFVLPASLVMLILSLDVPGILRLGPKAVIMLLTGTVGVVIGGPIALMICKQWLPPDAWKGLAALSGSWIGGAANMTALKQAAEASDAILGPIIVTDVSIAGLWMGILFYFAGKQHKIDRWTGANVEAIRDLERRMIDFQERTNRIPSLSDLMMIFALGFAGSWLSYKVGMLLPEITTGQSDILISHSTWKYILVTTGALILSFTRARNLEGAGASKIGTVCIYLLVACIGAKASFADIGKYPVFIVVGLIWMAVHVILLLVVGKLIRAPIFFIAVASQANIGGAASAPVVASAFHPSLAPVGALLAVAGYVMGTYAGLICMHALKWVAGSGGSG